MNEEQTPISVVLVGHVDHGKSTFIGRLLYDTGQLPPDRLADIKKASEEQGRRLEYAFFLDQFQEERDANVTIDTSQTLLSLNGQPFLIIDAPGHKEYLKNMVTGATQAQNALLMLDVNEGIREQTEKHARILKLLGIKRFAVMINKMDTVGYREDVFKKHEADLRVTLKTFGLIPAAIVPLSGYEGENLASKSKQMPWYAGPTAVDFLLTCRASEPAGPKAGLCFPVQLIIEHEGKKLALGRVERGAITAGMKAHSFPNNTPIEIARIHKLNATPAKAEEGECIALELASNQPLKRGHVFVSADDNAGGANQFSCQTFWASAAPLKIGDSIHLECRTQSALCSVTAIEDDLTGKKTDSLAGGDLSRVIFTANEPILLGTPDQNEPLSRVVFHKDSDVAGCGVVQTVIALLLAFLTATAPAYAYLDPGTGVTFVSGIGGFLMGLIALAFGSLVLFFKKWSAGIKSLLQRLKNRKNPK